MSSSTPSNSPFWARWWSQIFGSSEGSVRESIEDVLGDSAAGEEDGFSREELHMLRNLLGFRDVRIEHVMVPRADIEATEIESPQRQVLAQFADCGHSRMPIYRDTLDQPLGMLHVKDLMSAMHENDDINDIDVHRLIRPVIFVPPSMPAIDLLLKMQATHSHMALVIDEYGGTDGLVTIEDLIEEIVGDIEDEHDENGASLLRQESAGHWRAQARVTVAELEEKLALPFSNDADFEDIDTLGGLVFAIAGRVPERGEMISYQFEDGCEVEFVIRDGDPRRIKIVDIKSRPAPEQ